MNPETYYHVILWTGEDAFHWWANFTYDELVQELIIPYINKQVVPVTTYHGGDAMLNFGAVSYLKVFKTDKLLSNNVFLDKDVGDILLSKKFRNKECTKEIIEKAMLDNTQLAPQSVFQLRFIPPKQQAMVIMDFKSKAMDSVYEDIVKPVILDFILIPLKFNELKNNTKINDKILEEIANSRIIITDLSGLSHNHYYYIGFAYAIGKEIILTAKKGSHSHFDLATLPVSEWKNKAELEKIIISRLKSLTRKTISKNFQTT